MPKPYSISATALDKFRGCKAAWYAEAYLRCPSPDSNPALVGTAVHAVLERYVRDVHLEKTHPGGLEYVEQLWEESYSEHFATEFDPSLHADGKQLVTRWYKRDPLGGGPGTANPVLSVERKLNFPFKTPTGPVPFNYILDRLDLVRGTPDAPLEVQVVDYKGLALDTPIPTPRGWTTMGEISVGDELFGGDGKVCRVAAKSRVHTDRACYRMSFDDGSSIVCDDEHRWEVQVGPKSATAVLTTREILARGLRPDGQRDIRINNTCLSTEDAPLGVDPYVLGAWIGDGTARSGSITKPDEWLFDEIRRRGFEVGPYAGNGAPTRTVYGLRGGLAHLGVLENKHIPQRYLRASFSQRLDLLRGIMDTDGHWNPIRKRAVLNITKEWFARQTAELVVSLGWKATVFKTTAHGFGKNWDAWQLWFTPVGANPFLARNQGIEIKSTVRSRRRIIRSLERVATVPTQCIEVDSPDHCFLAGESMVKTHNTVRNPIDPADLKHKFQARAYALMMYMQYPTLEEVWVVFDLLRFGKVGARFTKDDSRATYRSITKALREAYEMPEITDPAGLDRYATVGPSCLWCVRKEKCTKLASTRIPGSVDTITSLAAATDLYVEVAAAAKALRYAEESLKDRIMHLARRDKTLEATGNKATLAITAGKSKKFDADLAARIPDRAVVDRYAGMSLNLMSLNAMMKDPDVTPEQRAQLSALVREELGPARLKVTPLSDD